MEIKTLKEFQYNTIERLYQLVDDLALTAGSTDLDYIESETKRVRKAFEAELEGLVEIVKEYHDI